MPKSKNKISLFVGAHWQVMGIIGILLLAILLLWNENANSMQAQPALIAQVRFEGEYRIADGPWQEITEGKHIPATDGDVILRGQFHMLTPTGEYVGVYTGDTPIAFYADHINLTFYEGDQEPFVMDLENPLYGDSACGVSWLAYRLTGESTEPIEIRIHNPHRFGNETAIDDMLSSTAFWANIEFENSVLKQGEFQRDTGYFFLIVSLAILGIAVFSTLIHIKNSKLLWLLGLVIFFAGTYFAYSAQGVSFWQESIVSNTTILGCAMMFYMFFLSVTIAYFLERTQKVGICTVICLGAADSLLFLLSMLTDLRFYDTWPWWILLQLIAYGILLACLIRECFRGKGQNKWLCVGTMFPMIAFAVDAVMTDCGVFDGGVVSRWVFVVLFAVVLVTVLKIIPQGINAAAKAKELETEKTMLRAQLTESRISTMMSQIRPHFIYNTLGSIEQLCSIDPPKAGELVHNFAKYLRGNFGELDNPKPILMSQEMAHVHHYISIENVRFPDMTFSFEMNSDDFYIPALTIQPIVENAIKHGLMKLTKGGRIRVVSYETGSDYCVSVEDDGVGFDINELRDERKHVGIRNIRERLKTMVNGTLEINSTVGSGTKVLIKIPKEVRK